jgi:peptidylprolyl isomerase
MNLMNLSKGLVAIVLLAAFTVACNTDKNKYPGFVQTEDGLFYKFHNQSSDTTTAREGDKISAYMTYRTMDDSTFSHSQEGTPFELPMMKSTYKGDVFEALSLMHPGDSATFILNSDSFFMKTVGAPRPELLDSGSTFYLDVKVTKIMTPEQMDKERMEQEKAMAEMEKSIIGDYIASNNLKVEADPSGIFFIKTKKGSGKNVTTGLFAKMHIVAKTIGVQGQEFINTYNDGKPIDLEVGTGQLGIGFETGIMKMKVGDKATIIAPFSLAFGAQGMRGYVPPFATIVYDVELLGLTTKEKMVEARQKEAAKAEASEMKGLKKYLADNNITVAPTASGLYYVEEVAGSGKQATAGKKVKVHYTGYLLDGTKFDSSVDRGTPFEFTIGQGQVIPGWDEGVALMKEGGKAKLIIPSKLGYGPRGAGQSIPPNSSLVFDVELIEVVD